MNELSPSPHIEKASLELPMALSRIKAGFPSPADDYLEDRLDIRRYLVKRPSTTFFMRVTGDSMRDAGINDGDLLVIDRAEPARDRSVVVARINDEFCVKELRIVDGRYWLYPANAKYEPVEIKEDDEAEIWGTVTHSITDIKRRKP
jgi:DNA polymerase V